MDEGTKGEGIGRALALLRQVLLQEPEPRVPEPRVPPTARSNAVDTVDAVATERAPQAWLLASTSSRFHYSRTEITLSGGQSRVQHRQVRVEDGRMTSEEFEGNFSAAEGERLMAEAVRRQTEQLRQFWSLFFSPWR